jgi:hypothetical protein
MDEMFGRDRNNLAAVAVFDSSRRSVQEWKGASMRLVSNRKFPSFNGISARYIKERDKEGSFVLSLS